MATWLKLVTETLSQEKYIIGVREDSREEWLGNYHKGQEKQDVMEELNKCL